MGLLLLIVPGVGSAILPEPTSSRPQHLIRVDGGNVGDLIEAIEEANGPKYSEYVITIEVAGDFSFTDAHDLPPIMLT